MRFTRVMTLIALAAFAAPAAAQTAPAPAVTSGRTLVAAAKLPSLGDAPLHFRALSLTLPPGSGSTVSATNGILYAVSGTATVSIGADTKTLKPGEGVFVPGSTVTTLKAGDAEPSSFMHFLLGSAADLEKVTASAPAVVKTLYRTAAPLPGLTPGTHDLNLARITFPAQSPSNRPHHRTGGALYYVVSGTGVNTIEGRAEDKPPGSFIYEPSGLVHQWGSPGTEPFMFLVFNINREGVPAVAADEPAKAQ